MHHFSSGNGIKYKSFIKRRAGQLLILIIISTVFVSCSSQSAMKKKIINTNKEISDGLRKGNIIYFLCDYVLSESGTTIIPMYMYSAGDIYYDKVFLYAFDITTDRLIRLAELKPVSSSNGRGSVKNARWADENTKIYVTYHTGWDKTARKYSDDVFCFDFKLNVVTELKNDDKEKLLCSVFPGRKTTNVISMTKVMFYAGCMPYEAWQLPSPADNSTMNNSEKERAIVEQLGDRYFQDAVFRTMSKSITGKEADRIILLMREWNEKLPKHRQMIYTPHMEEWSAKFSIAAGLNNGNAPNSVIHADNAEFLKAAYTDNLQRLKDLLKTTDINAADKNSCTALMYAIFGKAPHTMEILIRNGADIKRQSKSGYTAWMFVSGSELRQRYLGLTEK